MKGGDESPYGQKNLKWDTSEKRFQQSLGRRKANELQCSAMEHDMKERFRTGANHEVESKVLVSGIWRPPTLLMTHYKESQDSGYNCTHNEIYYSDTRRTSRKIIGRVWKNKCTGFLYSVLYHTEHTFLPLGKMQHHVCFCPGKPVWDQQFRVLTEGWSCKQIVPSNYEKQEFTINHSVVQTEETQQTNLTT